MFLRALIVVSMLFGLSAGAEVRGQVPEERVQLGIPVPMRDGVKLLTDVYLPEGDGPFPVILSRVPYGTQSDYIFQPRMGEFFTDHGYVYVSQNVRGRFGSEGRFTGFTIDQEIPDGYDTVEWIVKQPWSNGKVGAMGESYYGYTSLMLAAGGHPAVEAFSPANITYAREKQVLDGAFPILSGSLWTLDMDDPGGEYQDISEDRLDYYELPIINWGKNAGLRDSLWRERVAGYTRNPRVKERGALERYESVCVPGLHYGGWYDVYTRGTIAIWEGIREHSQCEAARKEQWLVMGPWDHESMGVHPDSKKYSTKLGRRDMGDAYLNSYREIMLAFFAHFLKEESNGFDARPRVHYYNIGSNAWRDAQHWPPAESEVLSLYLHKDGSLGRDGPSDAAVTRYLYDPRDPVTISAGVDIWHWASAQPDRRELVERDDVLVFETEPLEADLNVTGPIRVELYASSTATDTDFTGALVDVAPDGYSLLIQEGILRASYRNREDDITPIIPGEVYLFDIDLWATSYTVPAGHRLRVEISSSNFPRYARNLNNGEPFGMSDWIEVAEQTIHHSPDFPSRILLRVIR